MEEDSFNHFVDKGQHASADWRSKMLVQACFQKTVEDFLDAEFQDVV